MSVLNLLSRLNELEITIQPLGDQLKISGAEEKLTPALIDELKDKKREIIAFMQKNVGKKLKYESIELVEKKEYYKVSSAQKRFYILQQIEPGKISYNLPFMFSLHGPIDMRNLEEIFKKLVSRHESLRTSFQLIDDEPFQKIHETVEFEIEYYDLQVTGAGDRCGWKEERSKEPAAGNQQGVTSLIKDFISPFDLSQAPLLRVGLIKLPHNSAARRGHPSQEGREHQYLLIVDMHHIITDGTTQEILASEFSALSNRKELPALRLRYKDYSEWQYNKKINEAFKKQEEYWQQQFEAEIPVLNMSYDYPRPALQSFEGSYVQFQLAEKETRALNEIARSQEASLFMVLLTVYNIFLSRLCNQEDVIVGTPLAGRKHADLEKIIGVFINTLALRSFPSGRKTCKEFLGEVKERTIKAFDNQDYPFEDIVDSAAVQRDMSRNPLFDVLFILQNYFNPTGNKGKGGMKNLPVEPYEFDYGISKFDLTLGAIEIEKKLYLSFEYCTKLFRQETIERFIQFFKRVIWSIVEKPEIKISEIRLITEEEKNQILDDFNDTEAGYPRDKTVHQLYAEQVARTPDHVALIGQSTKQEGTRGLAPLSDLVSITYRELNHQSGQLAASLMKKGVQADTIAGIMMERSVEIIIGILGILKAGGAYLPIDPDYPEERIIYMLKDSSAKILATSPVLSEKFEKLLIVNCQLSMVNKELAEGRRLNMPPQEVSSHLHLSPAPVTSLAYLIYTSGSTGKPKGILVQHQSVVNILTALQREYPLAEKDAYLFKTSYLFDVSVTELFGWYMGGSRLAVLEKNGEKDPGKIMDAVQRTGITHINFVPSMFNVFVDRLSSQNIDKISSLKYIFLAGEVLWPELIRKFRRLNNAIKLENIYGPTEGTIYSSKYSLSYWEGKETVPIGKPLHNTTLYILDKNNHLQPVGIPGELCIGGTGTARGYLNKPELTAEKFIELEFKVEKVPCKSIGKRIYRSYRSHMSYIYRTGDLVRWLSDGNIEFLTRIDYQVKIRGFRIELGEIENRLSGYNGIEAAVVISKEKQNQDRYLCAYIVSPNEIPVSELREYLLKYLPEYMVPSYFMVLEQIPLTPNGKVDTKSLPDPEIKTGEDYVAPRNDVEEKLAEIWSQELGIKKNIIGIDSNFFKLGGHSLNAIVIAAKIHKELNVKVPLAEVFKTPTINELSLYINREIIDRYQSIEAVEKKEYYSLSSAQKRLFILSVIEGKNSTNYNLTYVVLIKYKLQRRKLEQVFKTLIKRHESLRTSFVLLDQQPVQIIHAYLEFQIEYSECDEKKAKQRVDNFKKPFDLNQAPLLRVEFLKTGENRYILAVDMPHIIADGVSLEVLIKEFMILYRGEKLSPLRIQYKDYSQWQSGLSEAGKLKKYEEYWLKVFNGDIPVLDLATDYPRPTIRSLQGKILFFELNKELTNKIRQINLETETTLYMVLLAGFNILLAKYSLQEEIIVGTPVTGRNHADLQNIIGSFANMLAMKNYPGENKIFIDFLKEVKENALQAYENQDFPFEELVEKLRIKKDPARNPLFDVVLNMVNLQEQEQKQEQNTEKWKEKADDQAGIEPYEFEQTTSKYDLLIRAAGSNNTVFLSLEYSTALFKPETVKRLMNHFIEILEQVMENKELKIKDIIISPGDFLLVKSPVKGEDMGFDF